MSRGPNEEWERRKWYLVRSLFEVLPALSPIQETQEQSLESRLSTECGTSRPSSPLPDLIIEKEPNRHDDSEEYYQGLEKKALIMYKRLFFNADASPIRETFSDADMIAEEASQLESFKYLKSTRSSTPSPANPIILTQADVHQTDIDITHHVEPSPPNSISAEIENHNTNGTAIDKLPMASLSSSREAITEFTSAQFNSSVSSDELEEPEIMRGYDISNESVKSIRTLNDRRISDCTQGTVVNVNSAREMEEVETSVSDFSLILGTTSASKQIATTTTQNYNRQDGCTRRKSSLEMSSDQSVRISSHKRRKLENVATQTSFSTSDDECDWEEIKTHLFVGNPLIYKWCSCSNHVCC